MKKTQPFGYPVSPAGLPRHLCTSPVSGDENIVDLTPQELTKTYWLLHSIHLEYAYWIHNIRRERKILLKSDLVPKDRIVLDPVFFHTDLDEYKIDNTAQLRLSSTSQMWDKYNIQLSIEEHDTQFLFMLSCRDFDKYRLLDRHKFKLMNRELSLQLWTAHETWEGGIEYINAHTEYYVID